MLIGHGIWNFFAKKNPLIAPQSKLSVRLQQRPLHWSAAVLAVGHQVKFSIHPVQYDEGVRVAVGAVDECSGFQ